MNNYSISNGFQKSYNKNNIIHKKKSKEGRQLFGLSQNKNSLEQRNNLINSKNIIQQQNNSFKRKSSQLLSDNNQEINTSIINIIQIDDIINSYSNNQVDKNDLEQLRIKEQQLLWELYSDKHGLYIIGASNEQKRYYLIFEQAVILIKPQQGKEVKGITDRNIQFNQIQDYFKNDESNDLYWNMFVQSLSHQNYVNNIPQKHSKLSLTQDNIIQDKSIKRNVNKDFNYTVYNIYENAVNLISTLLELKSDEVSVMSNHIINNDYMEYFKKYQKNDAYGTILAILEGMNENLLKAAKDLHDVTVSDVGSENQSCEQSKSNAYALLSMLESSSVNYDMMVELMEIINLCNIRGDDDSNITLEQITQIENILKQYKPYFSDEMQDIVNDCINDISFFMTTFYGHLNDAILFIQDNLKILNYALHKCKKFNENSLYGLSDGDAVQQILNFTVSKNNRTVHRELLITLLPNMPHDNEKVYKTQFENNLKQYQYFNYDNFDKLGNEIIFGAILDSMNSPGNTNPTSKKDQLLKTIQDESENANSSVIIEYLSNIIKYNSLHLDDQINIDKCLKILMIEVIKDYKNI